MANGKHIFISYSRRDGDFALKLAQDLRAAGVDIWLDQLDIPPGARWDRTVDQALRTCGRLLLILSPDSAGSENVMDEVAVAMHEGKPVVPVLHRPCEVPLRLMRLQHIDFTQDHNKGLNALLTHLREAGKVEPVRAEELSEAKAPKPRPGKPVAQGKPVFHSTTKPTPAWQRPMIYAASAVALIVLVVVLFKNFASQSDSNTSDLPHSQETKTQPVTTDKSEPKPSKKDESSERTKETPSPVTPSTDRDHPTPLSTNEIRGLGLGERVSHYYSFTAGPGELKITLTVEGGQIRIKLYNTDWKELLELDEFAPLALGSKRKVERVQIPRQQALIMEVSELLYYDNVVKSYLIRLEGPIQYSQEPKTTSDQSQPNLSKKAESVDQTKETLSPVTPSTDRDHPTPLSTNEIRGLGLGERVSHYYSFTAGPGELKITLDVEGGQVRIKLYNTDWKELLELDEFAPLALGSKRKVERVQIPRQQALIMEVSELLYYDNVVKSYLIRLEGAVQFEQIRPVINQLSLSKKIRGKLFGTTIGEPAKWKEID